MGLGVCCIDGGSEMSVARRVEAEAQRSLELLRAIEKTVENVVGMSKVFEGIAESVRDLAGRIVVGDEKAELDPDGKNVEVFATGQAVCEELLARFERCLDSARADARLREDDGVAAAYEQAIAAVRDLVGAMEDLIVAITVHDGAASGPASEPFTCADDLIAFLRR